MKESPTRTAPGIPMLFQGQEFLQGEWFRDDVPLNWDMNEEYQGIVRLYRDLIGLAVQGEMPMPGGTGKICPPVSHLSRGSLKSWVRSGLVWQPVQSPTAFTR